MEDEARKPPTTGEGEPAREERPHRRFTLADAIGRAGGDLMKGASPVTSRQRAEFEIERGLERGLDDAEGALRAVVLRRVGESESLLATSYDEPISALTAWLESILAAEGRLVRLVREVDAEWGRIYLERPHFDGVGGAADGADPYTLASVRSQLERLLEALAAPKD